MRDAFRVDRFALKVLSTEQHNDAELLHYAPTALLDAVAPGTTGLWADFYYLRDIARHILNLDFSYLSTRLIVGSQRLNRSKSFWQHSPAKPAIESEDAHAVSCKDLRNDVRSQDQQSLRPGVERTQIDYSASFAADTTVDSSGRHNMCQGQKAQDAAEKRAISKADSWVSSTSNQIRLESRFLENESAGRRPIAQRNSGDLTTMQHGGVYIALGSNVGDRIEAIESACRIIDADQDMKILKISPLYETAPMYVEDQAPFLNGVCEIETQLPPMDLLDKLQAIEQDLGRVKMIDKGPRNIDLDILLYRNEVVDTERLTVPHALMLEREFVLRPLSQ
nr:folic acid synthesis protein fol1 [Quercus suber]